MADTPSHFTLVVEWILGACVSALMIVFGWLRSVDQKRFGQIETRLDLEGQRVQKLDETVAKDYLDKSEVRRAILEGVRLHVQEALSPLSEQLIRMDERLKTLPTSDEIETLINSRLN